MSMVNVKMIMMYQMCDMYERGVVTSKCYKDKENKIRTDSYLEELRL